MPRLARHLLIVATIAFALLVGAWASGPYLAMRGIRDALAAQDMAALSRHVDFPALRVNMKAHVRDLLLRKGDATLPDGLIGDLLQRAGGGVADAATDLLLTPVGIAALLEGRGILKKLQGETVDGDTYGAAPPFDPLREVQTRFESLDRFTASTRHADGDPLVFVFQRSGLRWRLVDVRFGPAAQP